MTSYENRLTELNAEIEENTNSLEEAEAAKSAVEEELNGI